MTQAIIVLGAGNISLTRSILDSLANMATVTIEDIESGIKDGTYEIAENRDIGARREALNQVLALIKAENLEIIEVPIGLGKVLIDIGTAHVEDVLTGLVSRTYDIAGNADILEKLETLDVARTVYLSTIIEHQTRAKVEEEALSELREARRAFGVIGNSTDSATSSSMALHWFARLGKLFLPQAQPVSPEGRAMRFNGLFADAFAPIAQTDPTLQVRREALKAAVRSDYKDTGDSEADLIHLTTLIQRAAVQMEDGAVLGLDGNRFVIQWDAHAKTHYTAGETLDVFGIHNLREHELELVHVLHDTWRASIAAANEPAAA
ncbi:hypothetical protein [Paraburkholderia sp. SIMBA_054]|uniref:hypothetical protein n=1 Tax=Paraburkholderia sp. SIMBA_054 TaxID=3085795 RepID=UPI00397B018E